MREIKKEKENDLIRRNLPVDLGAKREGAVVEGVPKRGLLSPPPSVFALAVKENEGALATG